jgi:hypothetical protein
MCERSLDRSTLQGTQKAAAAAETDPGEAKEKIRTQNRS